MQRSLGPGILRPNNVAALQALSQGCSCWLNSAWGFVVGAMPPPLQTKVRFSRIAFVNARSWRETLNRHQAGRPRPRAASRALLQAGQPGRRRWPAVARKRQCRCSNAPQRPRRRVAGGFRGRQSADAVRCRRSRRGRKRIGLPEIEQGSAGRSAGPATSSGNSRQSQDHAPPALQPSPPRGARRRGTATQQGWVRQGGPPQPARTSREEHGASLSAPQAAERMAHQAQPVPAPPPSKKGLHLARPEANCRGRRAGGRNRPKPIRSRP